MSVKQTTIFKSLSRRETNATKIKKTIIKKFNVTIEDNQLKFIKLINSDGEYLMKDKTDEYEFDFIGNNLKDIQLVVFDVIKNKFNYKIYKNLNVENFDAQETGFITINNVDIEEAIDSELTATNIFDNKDIFKINSINYRFLFTNKKRDTLYYFNNYDQILAKHLKDFFNVGSIDFEEKFLQTSSKSKSGGKRILKKY